LEPAKVGMRRMQSELMERYKRGPLLLGQPWPFQELNHCTKGLRDSVVYIVAGRPSMGKSVFGLQVAVNNALNGNNTAFFSVEMSADECMARAVACVGEIPHEWVESPNDKDMDADFYWSRLSTATQRIIESPLLIDETPSISIAQLMARARRAHMQKPLRLIVVDHMHDMAIDPKQARFDYGLIVQGGKVLAKEFRCPVVILGQLNRQAASRTDKRPTMTDLRESGEIEQKADVILFLHREDYYDKNTHMKGVVEVIPAKGRNIKTGETILLKNVFSEMRMKDWVGEWPEAPEREHKNGRGMR
jgi:replicative DNA helicase